MKIDSLVHAVISGRISTNICTILNSCTPGVGLFFQHFKLFTRLAFEFPLSKGHVLPPSDMKRNHPVLDVLEDRDGLAVRHSLKDLPVDRKNLIA